MPMYIALSYHCDDDDTSPSSETPVEELPSPEGHVATGWLRPGAVPYGHFDRKLVVHADCMNDIEQSGIVSNPPTSTIWHPEPLQHQHSMCMFWFALVDIRHADTCSGQEKLKNKKDKNKKERTRKTKHKECSEHCLHCAENWSEEQEQDDLLVKNEFNSSTMQITIRV